MELETLFNCLILGGFVLPVLEILIGAIGGALDWGGGLDLDADLDLDAGLDAGADLDGGTPAGHGKLPVNLLTLSLSAVVFGALGRLLLGKLPDFWTVVVSLQAGVLAGFLVGWYVIRPLKRNRAYAANIRALCGRRAQVSLEVRRDFTGTIRTLSATGSLVSYDARPVEGVEKIPVGTEVSIVDVDPEKGLCWICPLENKKSSKEE